jgi:DNA-binding beta-propeller fold protein YncE
MRYEGTAAANRAGVTMRGPSRFVAAERRRRRLLLVAPLICWAAAVPSSSADAGTASAASQTTVSVSAVPGALADDLRTGRVFVVTRNPVRRFTGAVVVLDAGSGKVLASVPLGVPNPHGVATSGQRLPVGVTCRECIAVDDRNGRVFVLSPGLPGAPDSPTHPPAYLFMFDGTSGRLLATTSLVVRFGSAYFDSVLVVDNTTNRVFSANGGTNRLSVLDATTGKLLKTVVFPNHQSPDPSPVLPLGVDSRDGWVLVSAPDGPVVVDEHTGKVVRPIRLPGSQGLDEGLVDGSRGRAVLSVTVDHLDQEYNDELSFAVETIDLATGKVVGMLGASNAGHLLALDAQTGHALVFYASPRGSPLPGYLSMMDDTTGAARGGFALPGESDTAEAAATVNPVTGHALVVVADDEFGGPTHLLVVDLHTGKKLRDIPIAGVPGYAQPSIVVDGPTHHVFVTNPSLNSVTRLDGTKL